MGWPYWPKNKVKNTFYWHATITSIHSDVPTQYGWSDIQNILFYYALVSLGWLCLPKGLIHTIEWSSIWKTVCCQWPDVAAGHLYLTIFPGSIVQFRKWEYRHWITDLFSWSFYTTFFGFCQKVTYDILYFDYYYFICFDTAIALCFLYWSLFLSLIFVLIYIVYRRWCFLRLLQFVFNTKGVINRCQRLYNMTYSMFFFSISANVYVRCRTSYKSQTLM